MAAIANRNLLAAVCVGLCAATAAAQTPLFSSPVMSTRPTVPPPAGSSTALPPGGTTTSVPAPYTPATDVLTVPDGGVPAIPGAVYSPWTGDTPAGAMAPIGGNGPVTYEGYLRTGPSLAVGGTEMVHALHTGWMTAVGGRTLFFNTTNDAAWVLDVGVSYTRNWGKRLDRVVNVMANSLKGSNVVDNFPIPVGVQALRRTSLNFGLGRDWWLYGPGTVGPTDGFGNWRGGVDVGGRWGTASVDLEPQFDVDGIRRRQGVYHGVYLGASLNWEKQIGGTIFFAGVRGEWGYDWMNMLPPNNSDIQNINFLVYVGLRY